MALTFPATGYQIIVTDGPDAGVSPEKDLTTIGYQQDGVNAYFEIHVVDGTGWGVSFSNERFFVYIDVNADNNADFLLFTDNPIKTKLWRWDVPTGTWVNTFSNTASHLDPNATPDDHIYIGVALAEMGLSDGLVIGTSAATASWVPTFRNPWEESGYNDTTSPATVGYGILDSAPPTVLVGDTETATALIYDTSVTSVAFKWYNPLMSLVRDSGNVAVASSLAVDRWGQFAAADVGIWNVRAEYKNSAGAVLDADTVAFQVVYDCIDADGDGYGVGANCSAADCDDADPNVWSSCGLCIDADSDGWLSGCDAYTTVSGPDCDDLASSVYPGAAEACDGIDNQCPGDAGYGIVDESCGPLDTDGDGLSDDDENNVYFTDAGNPDTDGDGLGDYMEAVIRTCLDPLADDSDGDGLSDGVEDANRNGATDPGETDACNPDSDGDGAGDGEETGLSTNPLDWDTDGDGLPDGFEAGNMSASPSLDPLDPADSAADFDNDLNPNLHEFWNLSSLWTANPNNHIGHPQYSCAYWGEADGDCLISPVDLSMLRDRLLGGSVNYFAVIPGNGQTQDLDGDLLAGPVDLSIERDMVLGLAIASINTSPISLNLVSAPAVDVETGTTTHVTVEVVNASGKNTPGIAVHFEIDSASAGSGLLMGGDGGVGLARYDYSSDSVASALSNIVLRVDSPGVITINVYVPSCGTMGVGRNMNGMNMPPVTINAVAP